jgi:DNA-binding NtrC family response regulator
MALSTRVLVVEDDTDLRFLVERLLQARGFTTHSCGGAREALTALETQEFDTLITDLRMPEMDGFELCARIKIAHPHMGVVLVTAHGDMGSAREAMRLGIDDFIVKPVNLEDLERAIARANQRKAEVKRLHMQAPHDAFDRVVGTSSAIREVIGQMRRIAASDCTVLITGESGTGKELIARALHEHGPRRDKPFVPINCAALPAELLESEFFGHTRGAFTGAAETQPGLFVSAEGGTIFFDEVGSMPLELQAKLLRALQERTVRAVGSKNEHSINVRVIAAANQNLDEAVQHRSFRRDLLFRLDVMRIALPALRDRESDALLLADYFLKKHAPKLGKPSLCFSSEATERILGYSWPGNVRELENCVQAAIALARGERIMLDDLPPKIRKARKLTPLPHDERPSLPVLEEIERRHIERVLRAVSGNKAAAARILGINRVTLYRKLIQSSSRTNW